MKRVVTKKAKAVQPNFSLELSLLNVGSCSSVIFVKTPLAMNWQDYIQSNESILSGKPVIKGTRLSVEFLLERLADGWSEQDLLDNYPRLTKEAMQAVFAYVHATMKDNLIFFPTGNLRQAS